MNSANPQTTALLIAAALTVAIGIAHSYLGERFVLRRLFRDSQLPSVMGSAAMTANILRFAWHLTTLAWFGFAALLVLYSRSGVDSEMVGVVIGVTFALHAIVTAVMSRGRHLAWPVFFAIALLSVYALRA
jgi:hypothetical protein